jgi:serine/threonine protein kinase
MKQEEHDNILPFYGVSEGISEFCLVFPLYRNGNIMDYLGENPTTNRYNLVSTFKLTARSQRLLEFREQLLGAVNGLRFLHGARLVHGALQPVCRIPCS